MSGIKFYAEVVSQTKILIIVFILIVVCAQIFLILPYNVHEHMLDTKFGFDRSVVASAMNELGLKGKQVYILSGLILDTIFPILYVTLALGLFFRFGYQNNFIFIIPVLAGAADICENVQVAFMMSASSIIALTDIQIFLSSTFNQIKWALCFLTFLLIIVGVIKKLFYKD